MTACVEIILNTSTDKNVVQFKSIAVGFKIGKINPSRKQFVML